MIYLSDTYDNRPILSLRTGGVIGHAYTPIINSQNLKIEGWYATATGEKDHRILPAGELRDMIAKGFVVNDHDALTIPEDMVRMQAIIKAEFELKGISVVTESGDKLGKVQDFATEAETLYVKKLYVNQSLLRSLANFSKGQLIIDRSQIVDVKKDEIVVKGGEQKADSPEAMAARA